MTAGDLDELVDLQEQGAVVGLADVFPQDTHPFPRADVRARWAEEIDDPAIAAYVGVDGDRLVGFAARRGDELLHIGTALDTWGSGLATWLHDQLLLTFPPEVETLRLRVFVDNHRGRRFYEKLGWVPTGVESRTSFPPHPVLLEYTRSRKPG